MDNKTNKMVFRKEDIWLIPNIITYFRMICIPVFVTLCLVGGFNADKTNLIYWSLGVFFVAALSDLVDGKIARKFNMISDIGKVFDPLADKLMHISAILCLTIIGYMPWYFIVIVFVKEMALMSMSPVLLKKKIIIQAVFAGKIASACLSLGVVLAFFHPLLVDWWSFGNSVGVAMSVDWIIMLTGCVLAVYAAFAYLAIMIRELKKFNIDLAAGRIDRYGNRLDITENTEENVEIIEKNTEKNKENKDDSEEN